MPAFTYAALDQKGARAKGVLEGDNDRHIRNLLRERGLIPLEVSRVTNQAKRTWRLSLRFQKRLNTDDLALVTRQLATLLGAGLPVEQALQGVAEQTEKPAVKNILVAVRSRVLEGHSLAMALAQFPNAFPELYRATVAAGEQSGHLDIILSRLAEYAEAQQSIRQKLQQALIYPSIMIGVSIAIVSFLLVYVVPRIISVFSDTGQALPESTQILIGISHLLQHYGFYLLLVMLGLFYFIRRLLRKEHLRFKWHQLLLRLPVIGKALCTVNTARYARTLGILSAAGIPILECMRIASTLITCLPIKKACIQAASKVGEGGHIAGALKQTNYFAPMMLHLIASGEQTGQLEAMLTRAADNQDDAVKRLIATSLTLLEPMIILIMGAIVLFIVLAILLPIFALDQFTG